MPAMGYDPFDWSPEPPENPRNNTMQRSSSKRPAELRRAPLALAMMAAGLLGNAVANADSVLEEITKRLQST